jgi:T5orf172 domain
VYILSTGVYTEDQKKILKIGVTTQDLKTRIAQLYTTGTPFRFEDEGIQNQELRGAGASVAFATRPLPFE